MSKTFTLKNLVKLKINKTEPVCETRKESSYEPSAMVIANILNYSKALSIRKTNLLGAVDMVLN